MKRTAGTFLLLASLGGCMHADRSAKPAQTAKSAPVKMPNYQGPYGEPITANNSPRSQGGMSPGMSMNAGYFSGSTARAGTDLIQAGYLDGGCTNCGDGVGGGLHSHLGGHPEIGSKPALPDYNRYGGIRPVPGMGPNGAVAAVGALPAYGPQMPTGMRTSIRFSAPEEMLGYKVTWFGPAGWNDAPLIAPARYNFLQGAVYRLKVSSVPNHLDKVYYPTLEVLPGSPKTMTYLAHSSVPITFTNEDFEQVNSGNFLVKVVYLPDPNNQDLAVIAGPNELVSSRLEPGLDPIVEAQRRGTILLIVRMGNIDLQAPNTPAIDAPNPFMMRPPVMVQPPPMIKKEAGPAPKISIPAIPEEKKPGNLPVLPE